MNKLGFAIKRASQGASNVIECNKGSWTNKVVDIRGYLKFFNGLDGTDNMVTFMSFDEKGCFLTQLKRITGRVGDFLSGWIYIPNSIEISGAEVVKVYDYVKDILGESNINDVREKIESFFSKEYLTKELSVQYKPTNGELFGYRIIGHYSLPEIVGSDRYQPYYSDYKAIFLLDSNGEVEISPENKNKFKDLTKEQIVRICILKPATSGNLQFLGKGVKIVFQDGKEFNTPALYKKGDKVQLYAKRKDFDQYKLQTIEIIDSIQEMPEISEKVNWEKRISASMFDVKNEEGEKIPNVRIIVNKNEITNKDITLEERELHHVEVIIKAPDYEDYLGKIDLLNMSLEITLVRKEKELQYEIRLYNGKSAKIFLLSKDLPSCPDGKSPLEGYDLVGEGKLKISTSYKWKQRGLGFVCTIGLVLILILILGIVLADDAFTDAYEITFAWPPIVERIQNDTLQTNADTTSYSDPTADGPQALDEAIKYLESNKIWEKTKMDDYSALSGLYEKMNNFDLESLCGHWKEKLHDSNTFQKICKSAKKTLDNGWEPKQGDHSPTWNPDNDESINVTNYTNWLDQDQTASPLNDTGNNSNPVIGSGKHNTNAYKTGSKEDKKANKETPARNVEGNKNNDIFNRPS